jgi:hypothetical protein
VNVELAVPEAIGEPGLPFDQLGTQYSRVEGIRALPVADVDDAMVERDCR